MGNFFDKIAAHLETIFMTIMGLLVPSIGLSMFYGAITPLHVFYGFLTLLAAGLVIFIITIVIALIYHHLRLKMQGKKGENLMQKQIKFQNGKTYKTSKDIKVYSLRDIGFVEQERGDFTYGRPLYKDSPYNVAAYFKVDINKDLSELNILITDPTGLKQLNIYNEPEFTKMKKLIDYDLQDLQDHKIISEVK